jgi:hypothetical protein
MSPGSMSPPSDTPIDRILHDLQERAKELNCLYRVDELLGREQAPLDEILGEVARTLPAGWQFPDVCVARVVLGQRVYEPPGFQPSPHRMASLIEAQGEIAGEVEVYYPEAMPRSDEGPFLAEERKLLDAIAERIGHVFARRRLQRVLAHLPEAEVLSCIHSWIKEDKSTYLKNALERMDTPLAELADALQRFRHGGVEEQELSSATQMGLRAALVRRFLTDEIEFVNIAKEYTTLADFHELSQRIVYPPRSHGRLGGKAAGLFLASRIVAPSATPTSATPRCWWRSRASRAATCPTSRSAPTSSRTSWSPTSATCRSTPTTPRWSSTRASSAAPRTRSRASHTSSRASRTCCG